MPRVRAPEPKDEVMAAIDSGWIQEPDGSSHLVKAGVRLRRSHPAVKLAPTIFVPASWDDYEIGQARRALLEARGITERD